MDHSADVIVIGAGLAGLTCAVRLADAGRRVAVVDAEGEERIGGQAYWSFGGLFLVDTPEQRRLGIKDSADVALADWTAGAEWTDSPADRGGRRWAQAYVDFAATRMRSWVVEELGVTFFPLVQWAERGAGLASGPGSSVPRFHLTWGTGPGLLEPFVARTRLHAEQGRIDLRFRHRVSELSVTAGAIDGVVGQTLDGAPFSLHAPVVVVATGGIGGNHDLVRRFWPERLGAPPRDLLQGVPDHVDGSGLLLAEKAGAALVNMDRMWNYPEAIPHHTPRWSRHAVRMILGPSSLWLDATGRRLGPGHYPLHDTLATTEEILRRGHDHSWLLANERIVSKEWSLSGSANNPDLTGRSVRGLLRRSRPGPIPPVAELIERVPDIVVADDLEELVSRMNAVPGAGDVDPEVLGAEVRAIEREVVSGLGADAQLAAVAAHARYLPNKLMRNAGGVSYLDPDNGPLYAARMRILTRKTLGGIHTDLGARVLDESGASVDGLYAIGEVAGFGGGAYHGRRSMEGTFLGGCLFTGRVAADDILASS